MLFNVEHPLNLRGSSTPLLFLTTSTLANPKQCYKKRERLRLRSYIYLNQAIGTKTCQICNLHTLENKNDGFLMHKNVGVKEKN